MCVHEALTEAGKLAAENNKLRQELSKIADTPVQPEIVLEKVALSQAKIDDTLSVLGARQVMTGEARQKWARALQEDPNAALDLARTLTETLIDLPADPGGSPVEKTAGALHSLRETASAPGVSWFS